MKTLFTGILVLVLTAALDTPVFASDTKSANSFHLASLERRSHPGENPGIFEASRYETAFDIVLKVVEELGLEKQFYYDEFGGCNAKIKLPDGGSLFEIPGLDERTLYQAGMVMTKVEKDGNWMHFQRVSIVHCMGGGGGGSSFQFTQMHIWLLMITAIIFALRAARKNSGGPTPKPKPI